MRFEELRRFFEKAIAPLKRKVNLMVSRAVLSAIDDSKNIQLLKIQALADEVNDDVERIAEFGFNSHPPANSEAVVVSVGGNREHLIAVGTVHRDSRLKNLLEGETAIYTNDGTYIHLKKGGNVEVKTATKVLVDAPDSEFTGNVRIKGALTVDLTTTLKQAVTAQTTLAVTQSATVGTTLTVSGILSASAFSGLSGGAMQASVDIVTTGNVTGGGTDMATIKSTFNSHTHDETGSVTDAPNSTL